MTEFQGPSSVREALQRLNQGGLAELSPNKGARVITPQEVREAYEVRALLGALDRM